VEDLVDGSAPEVTTMQTSATYPSIHPGPTPTGRRRFARLGNRRDERFVRFLSGVTVRHAVTTKDGFANACGLAANHETGPRIFSTRTSAIELSPNPMIGK
jgi:hypothetical protein